MSNPPLAARPSIPSSSLIEWRDPLTSPPLPLAQCSRREAQALRTAPRPWSKRKKPYCAPEFPQGPRKAWRGRSRSPADPPAWTDLRSGARARAPGPGHGPRGEGRARGRACGRVSVLNPKVSLPNRGKARVAGPESAARSCLSRFRLGCSEDSSSYYLSGRRP